jgi:hypothetical protein
VWLESRFIRLADRIEIHGLYGNTVLVRKNNVWAIPEGVIDYPVKQVRVEELLRDLSRRKNYPIRSSTTEPERLGLGEGASRIIVRGGAGLPLLDLRIGFTDASGRELYLQKAGQREIRSGEDIFTIYTDRDPRFWYDLRLFPDLTPAMVQRVHIFPFISFSEGEDPFAPFTLSRRNNSWINESTGASVPRAEAWLRQLLDAQAEGFAQLTQGANSLDWEAAGTMVFELGDGSSRVFRISPPDAEGNRIAAISGSPFAYSLSDWTVRRLWTLGE